MPSHLTLESSLDVLSSLLRTRGNESSLFAHVPTKDQEVIKTDTTEDVQTKRLCSNIFLKLKAFGYWTFYQSSSCSLKRFSKQTSSSASQRHNSLRTHFMGFKNASSYKQLGFNDTRYFHLKKANQSSLIAMQ